MIEVSLSEESFHVKYESIGFHDKYLQLTLVFNVCLS